MGPRGIRQTRPEMRSFEQAEKDQKIPKPFIHRSALARPEQIVTAVNHMGPQKTLMKIGIRYIR
jgi:hypothetical protein